MENGSMSFISAEEWIQMAREDLEEFIPYKFEEKFKEKYGFRPIRVPLWYEVEVF